MAVASSEKANESGKLFESEESFKEGDLTLAKLPWAFGKIELGTITINERTIRVKGSHTLRELLDIIEADCGVKASYDFASDRIIIEGPSRYEIGSSVDRSNFLVMTGLQNRSACHVTRSWPLDNDPNNPVDAMNRLMAASTGGAEDEEEEAPKFDRASQKVEGEATKMDAEATLPLQPRNHI